MKPPKSSNPKQARGRPITRQIKINATPEQVAQAIFKAGRKPLEAESLRFFRLASRISPKERPVLSHVSRSILTALFCISTELVAYLDLKQTYGDSLSGE